MIRSIIIIVKTSNTRGKDKLERKQRRNNFKNETGLKKKKE